MTLLKTCETEPRFPAEAERIKVPPLLAPQCSRESRAFEAQLIQAWEFWKMPFRPGMLLTARRFFTLHAATKIHEQAFPVSFEIR